MTSVGSNLVCGFRVRDFWRVCSLVLVDEPRFRKVQSYGFGLFLATKDSRCFCYFGGVQSLVLVDEPWFE